MFWVWNVGAAILGPCGRRNATLCGVQLRSSAVRLRAATVTARHHLGGWPASPRGRPPAGRHGAVHADAGTRRCPINVSIIRFALQLSAAIHLLRRRVVRTLERSDNQTLIAIASATLLGLGLVVVGVLGYRLAWFERITQQISRDSDIERLARAIHAPLGASDEERREAWAAISDPQLRQERRRQAQAALQALREQ